MCPPPARRYDGHQEASTKNNRMGGVEKGEHKKIFPSNPMHPRLANWLTKQQGQAQGQGQDTYQRAPAMEAPAVASPAMQTNWDSQNQQQFMTQATMWQPAMLQQTMNMMQPSAMSQSHQQGMQGNFNPTLGMGPFF